MYAAELLELELPQEHKRLYAFVETDGCFSDGIAVATGCWVGHRTLRLIDFGKVAATFFDSVTHRCIRIWPHPAARERSNLYISDAQSRWHRQLEAYQIMPNYELLCVKEGALTFSMDEIISRPGARATCELCGEEILNEREVHPGGKLMCRSCAGEGYFVEHDMMSNKTLVR
jgi:formylmethanofuran dehydrogenase subunit E